MSKGREQVKALEAELGFELEEVEEKEIWNNDLAGYSLNQTGNLVGLGISKAGLEEIPKTLSQCTDLYTLNLKRNHIKDLKPIAHLWKLVNLNLAENQIKDLKPISLLLNLRVLDLIHNQIQDLKPITKVHDLYSLGLDNNQIQDIEPLIGLRELRFSFLQNNQIQVIPPKFIKWMEDRYVYLKNNPLIFPPPEILKQGYEATLKFYREAGDPEKINEIKVVLLGEGGSGKTSLVKAIQDQKHNPYEDTTHGIRIADWDFPYEEKDFKVRLWDFGGQEIYHATHQFFLSERSIYVLVLDARRDDKTEYWLRHAQNFGGDAPVLVVLNKADANPGFDINRSDLQKRYPQIVGFYRTSCETREGIAEFVTALKAAIPKVRLHEIWWPKSWLAVKQAMEKSKQPYLNRNAFFKLCEQQKVGDKEASKILVQLLHDLGVAIHFDEFDLKQLYILDPLWVTAAIYRIVRAPEISANGGILDLDHQLEACLARPNPSVQGCDREDFNFPEELHPQLIGLMKKFELCYQISGKNQILLPNLLPEDEPKYSFETDQPLRYQIQYAFLPPTLMPSLMVQRHDEIDGELRWRSGMVLKQATSGARALIRAYKEDRRIPVEIYGPQPQQFLASLRETFAKIHRRFQRNEIKELIACPCDSCRESTNPYYFDINAMIGCQVNGQLQMTCMRSYQGVTVDQILNEVDKNILPALADLSKELAKTKSDPEMAKEPNQLEKIISAKIGAFGVTVDVFELVKAIKKRWRR
jgi:small GTP-binding protein